MKRTSKNIFWVFILLFLVNPLILITLKSERSINGNYSITKLVKNIEKTTESLKVSNGASNFSKCNLTVIFHESTSSVDGNLTIDFYNNDPKNFTRLPFHLYLSGMVYDTRPGSITIVDVFKYGNFSKKLSYTVFSNDQLMWVNLSKPLEPNQRVKFIIQFNAILPDGGYDRANSHGMDIDNSRIYKFSGFYPIPCVYDQEDMWNTDPYLYTGDPFYFDMAYYNLFIKAPEEMKIAATGKLVNRFKEGSNILYHFDPIHPVREVTFSASKYFIVETKKVRNVNLSVFYLPKSYIWEDDAIEFAENALDLFNTTFGEYPYPSLNIVEEYTAFGGMEYPCQIYATEAIDDWSYPLDYKKLILEKVIVHEICHQWWYNLIGNDEIDYGFLDEGLTCWSTDYYGEVFYSDWTHFQYTPYIQLVRTYYSENQKPSKINQSIYEFISTETDYVFVAYTKAPLIFEILRGYIGTESFLNSLKAFYENYKYDHVNLKILQNTFENTTGKSLKWFFKPLFNNYYLPKYTFTDVSFNENSNLLTLSIIDTFESLNPFIYSQKIPLRILNAQNQILYSEIIWVNGTTTLNITLTGKPSLIRLIYDNNVLVQIEDTGVTSLDYRLFAPERIPGFNFKLILFIFTMFSIIIFVKRKIKIKE
jgi:hypothetical protein